MERRRASGAVDAMTEPSVDGWMSRGVEEARRVLGGGAWEATILHGTGGGLGGSGVARLHSGSDSVIVKVVRCNSAGPTEPASWRRELDLYGSDWMTAVLPERLALPERLGWAVTDEAAVIVLEDLPFDDRDARSSEWYRSLASELGRMAAMPVRGAPQWASRGFVAFEAARTTAAVPAMAHEPSLHLVELLAEWRPILDRLPTVMPQVLEWLDGLPHCFNHLDAFSRNAAQVGDRMVLIDWAYAGLAPIGTDPAGIVAMTGMHGDVPSEGIPTLYRSVVSGFTSGLTAERRAMDAHEVETAIEALLALRWVGFLGNVQGFGDELQTVVEQVTGRPLVELLAAWTELSRLSLPLAETMIDRFDP